MISPRFYIAVGFIGGAVAAVCFNTFRGAHTKHKKSNIADHNCIQQHGNDQLKVVVGSTNPVKINSVEQAFKQMFPHAAVVVEGVNVPSGVSDQPMSEKETKTGATNRALHAADSISRTDPDFDAQYAVGLEGGIQSAWEGSPLFDCFAWMAVCDIKKSLTFHARTASFTLPLQICQLVSEGMELGEADDEIFKRVNSKQSDGTVGILSHGNIDRTQYYKHALILALIPLVNPELTFSVG
mmetsp:Transcript_22051/g.43821  ORF Transcript_22051/g.43821 Transcript_22051/m.43821 type:complete len:240 (+) Transcript_22051:1-720(+)